MKSIKAVNYNSGNIPIWITIILLITTITFISSACAAPEKVTSQNNSENTEEKMETSETKAKIPSEVIQAVSQEIANNNEINIADLQVSETISQTWPDGCLGLAKADELCTQALVEGWQVTISNGDRTWIYRTDNTGFNLRLQSQSN